MTTAFAELTSPQVAALLAGERRPVLLLPVGAVEPHGPHAPLCTDPLISETMCEQAAQRLAGDPALRVLVLPALPYGVTHCAESFPGAVGVSASTLHALVTDVCVALLDQGFGAIVIVNNHFEPEHVATLRSVAQSLRHRGVGYLDLIRRHNAQRLTEEFRSGSCHAGRYETSLVLARRPELVDAVVLRELPGVEVDLVGELRAGHTDFRAMGMLDAYCGTPSAATAAEGAETFQTLTALLIETIREVVAG